MVRSRLRRLRPRTWRRRLRSGRSRPGSAQRPGRQVPAAVAQAQLARETPFDDDPRARPDSCRHGLLLPNLPEGVLPAHREVASHDPRSRVCEQGFEIGVRRQRAVRVQQIGGRHGEALVPERNPALLEKPVRLLDRRDPRHAHLLDQPVLRCAVGALDPPLRLGRARQDQLDGSMSRKRTFLLWRDEPAASTVDRPSQRAYLARSLGRMPLFGAHGMPNVKSAKKRMELSRAARVRNRAARSRMRTAIRRVREAGSSEQAEALRREAVALVDRAATRRLIHPNKAGRIKSQLDRIVR